MADEAVFLKIGDLLSFRYHADMLRGSGAYDTAKDALRLIGVNPNLTESELREKLGTKDD